MSLMVVLGYDQAENVGFCMIPLISIQYQP